MIDEPPSCPPSVPCRAACALALVGFMGAGKTSVGRELARRLGWRFMDLDELVERREGRSIPLIFADNGEETFRRLERSILLESIASLNRGSMVLALGGGAFIQPVVQQCLRQAQIPTVFLDAGCAELFRRCEQPGVDRPLRRHPEQFRQLYEQRRPQYLKAALRIQTEGKLVSDVVEEIVAQLNLISSSGAYE
jgi:shikimate kinase